MKKYIFCTFVFLFVFILGSCNTYTGFNVSIFNGEKDIDASYSVYSGERQWSILIYMAADNNLEASAIEDLNEMEFSNLDTDEVNILALVDRNNGYDSSNGNWSETRLYKIKTGKKSGTEIQSEEIEFSRLGLGPGKNVELDLSDGLILQHTLDFMISKYPANHYGLIIWGHGTGWRNDDVNENDIPSTYKGFAFDENSGTYMSLYQLNKAVENVFSEKAIDFIGFDTCFGGCLEVMYEFKDSALYAVGSEGLLLSSGWNYEIFFNCISLASSKSAETLCKCAIEQFSQVYGSSARASICAVDLSKIENLVCSFDEFSKVLSEKITSAALKDKVLGFLYSDKDCHTEKYTYGKSGFDVYLDTVSIVNESNRNFNDSRIETACKNFLETEQNCIFADWASDRDKGSLSVFFQTLSTDGLLAARHPDGYIYGNTINQLKFIKKCTGYVPGYSEDAGLLEKLFYYSF